MKSNENAGSQLLEISDTKKLLTVKRAVIDDSRFYMVCMDRLQFDDISAKNIKISNANLSDLEIEGAQLGGAYIHNIGMPPKGHPAYQSTAKQRPLKFEDCDLNNTTITNCNLSGVSISDCDISGLKINGVLIEDLLK